MQGWFEGAGFERHARVVDDEQGFGVGLHRLTGEPVPYERDRPLFPFVR